MVVNDNGFSGLGFLCWNVIVDEKLDKPCSYFFSLRSFWSEVFDSLD